MIGSRMFHEKLAILSAILVNTWYIFEEGGERKLGLCVEQGDSKIFKTIVIEILEQNN